MSYRLLLDTNVLLDYVVPNRPCEQSAHQLLLAISQQRFDGFVTPGTLKDMYYIASKYIGSDLSREYIADFLQMLTVLTIGQSECELAVRSDEPDFEDGLIRAAAETNRIDFIITRDNRAFERSTVRSMDAERFVKLFDELPE